MATEGELRAAAKAVVREFDRTRRHVLRQPLSEREVWLRQRHERHLEVIDLLERTLPRMWSEFFEMRVSRAEIQGAMLAFSDHPALRTGSSSGVRRIVRIRTARDVEAFGPDYLVDVLRREGNDVVDSAESTQGLSRDERRREQKLKLAPLVVSLIGVRIAGHGDEAVVVADAYRLVAQALITE